MENTEQRKDSVDENEIASLLNRREESNSTIEFLTWINASNEIVKSYKDGFISNKDIEQREAFVEYSFNRESMLVTCISLLEKSNDPKMAEKLSLLKHSLSLLKICRGNVLSKTPGKETAKVIHDQQLERKQKEVNATGVGKDSQNLSNNNSPTDKLKGLKSLFEGSNTPEKVCDSATIAFLLLPLLAQSKELQGVKNEILQGKVPENLAQYKDPSKVVSLLLSVKFLQQIGLSEAEIRYATENYGKDEYIANMQHIMHSKGFGMFDGSKLIAVQKGQSLDMVQESMTHQSYINSSAYDNGLISDFVNLTISEKDKADIIKHQASLLRLRGLQRSGVEIKRQPTPITTNSIDISRKNANTFNRS